MTWFRVLRGRLFALAHKAQLEKEMDEEIRFHLAMRTHENLRRGMPASAASSAATRQFGNINLIKDAWRDVTGGGALETLLQDVRFAVHMLRKDRTFTATALLALMLSIGANTALFTVVDSVTLRPLPYAAPDRIMAIWSGYTLSPGTQYPFSYPDFLDFQSNNHSFQAIGAFYSSGFVVSGGDAETMHIQGTYVTSDIFPLLGITPGQGRIFKSADDEPGARAVIISDDLWKTRFGQRWPVEQAALTIDGLDYHVVGVMPRGFRFPVQNEPAQLWITFSRDREPMHGAGAPLTTLRHNHYLKLLGRLKSNVTQSDAEADLRVVATHLAAKFPETNRRHDSCIVRPMLSDVTSGVRPALALLTGAGICILGLCQYR
jgi:putative ABC transport system permease protein